MPSSTMGRGVLVVILNLTGANGTPFALVGRLPMTAGNEKLKALYDAAQNFGNIPKGFPIAPEQ